MLHDHSRVQKTREGMAITHAKGKLHGKQPKRLKSNSVNRRDEYTPPAITPSAIWLKCSPYQDQQSIAPSTGTKPAPRHNMDDLLRCKIMPASPADYSLVAIKRFLVALARTTPTIQIKKPSMAVTCTRSPNINQAHIIVTEGVK